MKSERSQVSQTIKFGPGFELDLRTHEVSRAGRTLKLERIPTQILLLLIEHQGQLISRDQIAERVWGKGICLDTDNSINGAIRKIRQIFRDNPEQPRFIQTFTGRGYRFIAPVIENKQPVIAPASPALRTRVETVELPPPTIPNVELPVPEEKPSHRRWLLVVGVGVLSAVAMLSYFKWPRSVSSEELSGRRMLAVLPFENLTGDASQDYFSDGLTEEMISQVGNLDPEQLGVIARTSVMHYKKSKEQLGQIGHELGVQYVLEGSVRRDVNKVRVTAELIRVKDQSRVWAREYDRELSSLLSLQVEIALSIADEIQLSLGENRRIETAHPVALSRNGLEAYDLYLRGQYFWNKRTIEGFQRSIEYFEKAVAKDSNCARAYAGLADSYALLGGYSAVPQTRYMPKARAAALKALQIDDRLAEGHTALALIVQNYDWDWQTAEKEFRRAIELDPNYATAHQWYAEHLAWLGRFDDALAESERARQLDPLSLIIATDNGAILYYSRQYDRAIEKFNAVREMDPTFSKADSIAAAYQQKGMFSEALSAIEKIHSGDGAAPWKWAAIACVYGRAGQQAQARLWLAKIEQLNLRQPVDPSAFLGPHIALGDKGEAFADLEKSYVQHSNVLMTLKVDPAFDPLRSDPRFQELLLRVGLAR
ncbi:MAG: winged helix-turn-helix domain-containing protein [Acidobacteriota bacterium]|nr:winged helix-turn-helix domain-containing protein [Acidobacteriota bacterium]